VTLSPRGDDFGSLGTKQSPDMVCLSDAFRDPGSREQITIVFYDIVGSVGYKAAEVEATWVPTFGWVFDGVRAEIAFGGRGRIVKFTGDGAIVAYDENDADAAINDAIRVQERVQEGVEGRQVNITLTVGIATGEVVAFDTEPGTRDYLGLVVDRAARLCSAASAQAIFADAATIASARMNRVTSKVGRVMRRQVADYQGEIQKTSLKGFTAPVEYYEVFWAQQRFGLKSQVVTATFTSSTPSALPHVGAARPVAPADRPERLRGVVFSWKDGKRCAFIDGDSETRYFTNDRLMAARDDYLERGDVVFFFERSPGPSEKCPVATAVIAVGQELDGRMVKVGSGYGFVQVSDSYGNTQDIFVPLSEAPPGLVVGERIRFEVVEGERGPRAAHVTRVHQGGDEAPEPKAA
jgi:class 3 adenylate cyclase/cold shock CspA family protein